MQAAAGKIANRMANNAAAIAAVFTGSSSSKR